MRVYLKSVGLWVTENKPSFSKHNLLWKFPVCYASISCLHQKSPPIQPSRKLQLPASFQQVLLHCFWSVCAQYLPPQAQLGDEVLDFPHARELFVKILDQAKQGGWLLSQDEWNMPAETFLRSNFRIALVQHLWNSSLGQDSVSVYLSWDCSHVMVDGPAQSTQD